MDGSPGFCNYKRGEFVCKSVCHVTENAVRFKCFSKEKRNCSKRTRRLECKTDLLSALSVDKRAATLEVSRKSMEICRGKSKLLVNQLPEGSVRKIASQLIKIYTGLSFVQIANVICPSISARDISLEGSPEEITFSSGPPYLRSMQALSYPEDILSDVMMQFAVFFQIVRI